MITKGQSFTFMYETRNKNTGDLVEDAPLTNPSTHTIKVFYKNGSTWTSATIVNGVAPSSTLSDITSRPVFIGSDTGMYLCQISNTYTNCDHIIVSITSSNSDVIVPLQQFYPVSTTAIRDAVWSTDNGTRSLSTEPPTATTIASTVWSDSNTRSLTTEPPTATAIANAVWNRNSGTARQLTTNILDDSKETHDELALSGETSSNSGSSEDSGNTTTLTKAYIAEAVWNAVPATYQTNNTMGAYIQTLGSGSSGDSSSITVDTTSLTSQVSRLEGYIDTLSTNIGYLSTHTQTITSAATTLFTGTDNLASVITDIPKDVWTYTTYANIANQQPARAIADMVWGRSQNSTNRQLTTATLSGSGAGTLARTTDVAAPIIDSGDIQLTIPTATDVATAVWNFGKTAGSEDTTYRSLSTPVIIKKNGTMTVDVATVPTGSSTVDSVVWGAQNKTLSSKALDSGGNLALSTDIPASPDVSDLTTIVTLLTKVLGVLCHWKEDGSNIVVYNDENETILTIPTVKNKYGDILQMGTMPEE